MRKCHWCKDPNTRIEHKHLPGGIVHFVQCSGCGARGPQHLQESHAKDCWEQGPTDVPLELLVALTEWFEGQDSKPTTLLAQIEDLIEEHKDA